MHCCCQPAGLARPGKTALDVVDAIHRGETPTPTMDTLFDAPRESTGRRAPLPATELLPSDILMQDASPEPQSEAIPTCQHEGALHICRYLLMLTCCAVHVPRLLFISYQ